MSNACDITNRPPAPDENPEQTEIGNLLKNAKNIAVVGLSDKPDRESYRVGLYLVEHGYNVLPVHPNIKTWEGRTVYKSLAQIDLKIDIVDLFRNAEAIGNMVDEIVSVSPLCAWFQLGIVNNNAAKTLRSKGVMVVQDKCIKIEHSAL